MNRDVQPISPDQTLTEAAQQMRQHGLGVLPVCQHRKLMGLLTERDIVFQAIAERLDPQQTVVADILGEGPLRYAFADDELTTAAQLMSRHGLRQLPILDRDKNLVGMVSFEDISRAVLDDASGTEVPLAELVLGPH
ncbi:CBS domain-containing protein [Stigmatella sp. ncwal1]|uniref:CBS domain-containing protein n=1 Tax=Stigmatella ashevillensis TaxID=2995309 RepID=A0ABT5DN20_9BACT|nr:CBS domain-containing protein [Stigmatella ashevillena]MDC0714998.1 CBS domain-containing protein [Stigmatella ashevillena]